MTHTTGVLWAAEHREPRTSQPETGVVVDPGVKVTDEEYGGDGSVRDE